MTHSPNKFGTDEAARFLGITTDELLVLVQNGRIWATREVTAEWLFDLPDLRKLYQELNA